MDYKATYWLSLCYSYNEAKEWVGMQKSISTHQSESVPELRFNDQVRLVAGPQLKFYSWPVK